MDCTKSRTPAAADLPGRRVSVVQIPVRAARRGWLQLPRITMAWHSPAVFQPGDAELDMASHILGGGKSSRLYKTLVYDKQLAQSVQVQQYSASLGSVFSLTPRT